MIRISDPVDSYRDLLSGALDTHLVANIQGEPAFLVFGAGLEILPPCASCSGCGGAAG